MAITIQEIKNKAISDRLKILEQIQLDEAKSGRGYSVKSFRAGKEYEILNKRIRHTQFQK
jgi:hypothetical protein